MPTILRYNRFRFFFFSNEHIPEHIHIEKGDGYAKVELKSLKLIESCQFSKKDIKIMLKIVEENKDKFLKAWYEYFKS